jgi:hypothetical protein
MSDVAGIDGDGGKSRAEPFLDDLPILIVEVVAGLIERPVAVGIDPDRRRLRALPPERLSGRVGILDLFNVDNACAAGFRLAPMRLIFGLLRIASGLTTPCEVHRVTVRTTL